MGSTLAVEMAQAAQSRETRARHARGALLLRLMLLWGQRAGSSQARERGVHSSHQAVDAPGGFLVGCHEHGLW